MFIAVIVLGGVCAILLVVLLRKPAPHVADNNMAMLLKQDVTQLSQDITKLKDGLQNQLTDRLDRNQQMMRESIQKQFSESSKLITDVTERLTKLDETNKRVVDVADELKTLQNVLQNPKQRGVLGEYYLNQVLENVLPPGGFKLQYKLGKDDQGHDLICDAVIMLDKGKMLPVDSKFSLENYNRLVEEPDKARREVLAKVFKADLKNRIDETSKYIRPQEGTMDYAFMFIPSEAIYYDLLVNKVGATNTSARDLIEYAFHDRKVIIVSPTTFMAYLQAVLQGLRSLQIEEQAKEIQQRVGELGRHLGSYEQFMQKLGGSLSTTVNHFNNAHKELKKVDKDVVKIAHASPGIEPLLIDKPTFEED
ncbi:MAG TPA: DNA recombination protein RmuC [Candidatus Saccharimonadales bacterium]|jgi:DNA recombination protein RmuC|nr:DNA recombination protein RmuC [Candidatus Saccharimonadales bacterium]